MQTPEFKEKRKTTQWKAGESGNPDGKPKGALHLSTHIQNFLNDETFQAKILDGYNLKEVKGPPVKAIIEVAVKRSVAGDQRWADWLAKYGYGTTSVVKTEGEIKHTYEELDDEQLEAALKARKDRAA